MTCPHPEKIAYPSERSARAAIKSIKATKRDGGGFLHAYRCGAHWHVGHGHKSTPALPGRKFKR